MRTLLPVAFWALTAVVIVWNLQLAGRIAQNRRAPRAIALLSGLAGLLVVPAALAAAAAPSIFVGRAVQGIAWLWPLVAGLFALQVLYAVVRRYVTPAVGISFLLYDLVVLAAAVARYRTLGGGSDGDWLVALAAAQAGALGVVRGETALWSPFALMLPLLAPVTPARWRLSAVARAAFAVFAAGWAVLVLVIEYPRAVRGVRAFAAFGEARIVERPAGDLTVGLQLFPSLRDTPTELMLRNDVALADSLDVGTISITLAPTATRLRALDSLARLLEDVRRDTTTLVVSLDYPPDARAQYAASPERYTEARLAELRRVVRRLRPDVVIPAIEPYGQGARALGVLPLEAWQRYLTAAAAVVEEDRPRTLVGVSTATFGSRDSALYAWAASRASPIELVGFAIAPSFDGGLSLTARLGAADRWLRAADPDRAPKPHWIFHAVAYPLAHGEGSQRDALWGTLAWATAHPQVRGLIIGDAADYGRVTGLRVTGGRLRPAVALLAQGIELLRETAQ
jgi:hypothetical protein